MDIYCEKILTKEISVEVVHESTDVLAFRHTHPYWETHIVVIPKRHIDSLSSINVADMSTVAEMISVASKVCASIESSFGGCRLSTNVGNYQTSKHLHFYIHAGCRLRNEDGSTV